LPSSRKECEFPCRKDLLVSIERLDLLNLIVMRALQHG
jgi:hypothetical protein